VSDTFSSSIRTPFLHLLAFYSITSGDFESILSESVIASRVAISPDRQTLVTASTGLIHFWHLPTRRLMGSIPMRNESLAFSPDSNELYVTVPTAGGKVRQLRVISKAASSPRSQ
jgi:WD40 repeat protein